MGRKAQQPAGRRGHIRLAHQGFADKETARAGGGQAVEICGSADPAFGDDDAVRRHFRRQGFGGAQIGFERLQVAVVDADQPHRKAQGAVELGAVMDFGEHIETELGGGRRQLSGRCIGQRRHDQQDAVGPDAPAFQDLIRVEDEILAQHRQTDRLARRGEVVIAALEIGHVGQHRQAAGAARRIGAGERSADRNPSGSDRRWARPS